MAASVQHVVFHGTQVTINGDVDLSGPATSAVVYDVGHRLQEFTSGLAPFAASIAPKLAPGLVFAERYSLQGGDLSLGTVELQIKSKKGLARTIRRSVAIWEGAGGSLFTFTTRGTEDLLATFDKFTIRSTPLGLVLQPKAALAPSKDYPPRLMKIMPGLGALDAVRLTPSLTSQLPRWRGTAVSGGELFVEGASGERGMHFVLVTPTARVQCFPDQHDPQRLLDILPSLEVEWREA